MSNVVGTADIVIKATAPTFDDDVKAATAPGLASVGTSAETAGAEAGSKLSSGVTSGLADLGADVDKAAIPAFDSLKTAAATAGAEAGEEASTGMSDKLTTEGGGAFDKFKSLATGAAATIGIAFGAEIGSQLVEASEKDQAAEALLSNSFKNAGLNVDDYKASIEDMTSQFAKYGDTSSQVDDALSKLIGVTHDTKDAESDLSIAANLAASKHEDLATATAQVMKIQEGSFGTLTKLGVATKDQVKDLNDQYKSTGDVSGALDLLSQKTAGAADVMGGTFAGSMAGLKATAENLLATLGTSLLPVIQGIATVAANAAPIVGTVLVTAFHLLSDGITDAVSVIRPVFDFFDQNKALLIALGGTIATILVPAIAAWAAAEIPLVAEMVAQAAATVVAYAPIVAIGVAIGAVIAAVVELVDHWGTVWSTVKDVAGDAWNFIDSNLIQPLEGAFQTVEQGVDTVAGFFVALPGRIISGVGDLLHDAFGTLENAASWVDTNVIEPYVNFWIAIPTRTIAAVGDLLKAAFGTLENAASWVDTNVIEPVVQFFTNMPQQIVTAMGDVVSFIFDALGQAGAWVDKNVITPVVGYFKDLPGKIVTGLGDIVTTIWKPLAGAADYVYDNVIKPALAYWVALPEDIVKGMGLTAAYLWTGIKDAAQWVEDNVVTPVVNFFKKLPGDVMDAVNGLLGSFETFGKDLVGKIVDGIGSVASEIGSALEDAVKSGVGGIPIIGPILGKIPGLALGGIVTGPTLAVIGESGPEAVVPLPSGVNPTSIGIDSIPLPGASGSASNGAGSMFYVAPGAIVINPAPGNSQAVIDATTQAVYTGFQALADKLNAGTIPVAAAS